MRNINLTTPVHFLLASLHRSVAMSSSSASDSEDEAAFGRLVNITAVDLVTLGSRIRELVSKAKTSNGHLVETSSGSFNLVHILQLDEAKTVIRIPISGQSGDLSGPAKEALESQVQTTSIHYIKEHTSITVPKVFHLDTSANNEIGAPYIAMSYISRRTVSRLWFGDSGNTPLEERRRSILKQLARAMSQLNRLYFDKIESLISSSQGSGHDLGPCYEWDEGKHGTISVASSGPFLITISFLKRSWARTNDKSPYAVGAAKLLEEMLPHLPHSSEYVLALPDFDSQNVMVDEEGDITGLIDWDNVQTVPGFIGCLQYPGCITRDWEPLMYVWPQGRENSPTSCRSTVCITSMKRNRPSSHKVAMGTDSLRNLTSSRPFGSLCRMWGTGQAFARSSSRRPSADSTKRRCQIVWTRMLSIYFMILQLESWRVKIGRA